jgi:hypothetical protein
MRDTTRRHPLDHSPPRESDIMLRQPERFRARCGVRHDSNRERWLRQRKEDALTLRERIARSFRAMTGRA